MRVGAAFMVVCAVLSAVPRVHAQTLPAPAITAQLVPSTVQVGNAFTLVWNAANATALRMRCSGPMSHDAQLSGPSGILHTVATAEMRGTSTCTLTATGPAGEATSAALVLTVQDEPTSATCRIASTTCTEGPGTRIINGERVYRDCWRYDHQYECIEGGGVDNCAPIAAAASCRQQNSVCLQRAFDGRCLLYENDWRCDNPLQPEPPNVVRLPDTHTITRDEIDGSACDALAATNGCVRTSERTCVEGPETRNINGLDVSKDCWRWTETYTCIGASGEASDCAQYESNPACRLVSEECADNTVGTVCGLRYRRYECSNPGTAPVEVTTCGGTVCIAGVCDATDTPPDQDFGRAITALEIARQAATYGDVVGDRFFQGQPDWCKRTFGAFSSTGLFSCCGSKVTYNTSNREATIAIRYAARTTIEAIRFLGSFYMQDLLAFVPEWILNLIYGSNWVSSITHTGWYQTTVGGVQVSAQQVGAGYEITYSVNWAWVWAFIIITAVSLYAECDEEEHRLSLRKGQNLCHYVGRFCSERSPGIGYRPCRKYKDGYCCFNSKLARIVQQQGRAQLGLGWGSAQSPDCRGLTLAEIQSLDFSRMDFSEFIADVGWHSVQTDPETGVQTLRVDPPRINTDAARARAPGRATELRNAPTPYFPPQYDIRTCVPPNC